MRLYSKTFLVLALSASFTCGALSLAKAENNDNADMPPVSSFDNNAAYRGLSPEKRTKYNDIMKSTEEAMLPLREQMMAKRLELQSIRGCAVLAASATITAITGRWAVTAWAA